MSTTIRAPFPWYGSKRGAAPLIESLHGPVTNLVIPFAGSLGELLGRSEPAKIETVNDLDGLIVNAWRAIKHDPDRVAALCDQPVHEVTLHAVHDRLVHARTTKGVRSRSLKSGRRRTVPLGEYLRADERHFDVHVAARWIWGASCWLGSGWCREQTQGTTHRQVPHLSGGAGYPGHGKGVHSGHRDSLLEWMVALSERLRKTRIICGDWTRAVTVAVTTSHGVTGVNLDPTYDLQSTQRSARFYRKGDPGLSSSVRRWALENGDDPLLRLTLCGKHNEHDELLGRGWTKHTWRSDGETIWASPHCLAAVQGDLFAEAG